MPRNGRAVSRWATPAGAASQDHHGRYRLAGSWRLLGILGGLFAIITMSDVIQVGVFKVTRIRTGTGRRMFKMAPLHYHIELKGWADPTIVIRFWLTSGICVALGLAIFYAAWVQT